MQKTLLNIEGLGRQLYPDLDLWTTAKPFLERWMKEQIGLGAFWNNVKTSAPQWLETFPQLPELTRHALQQLSNQQKQHQQTLHEIRALRQDLRASKTSKNGVLAGATALVSGSILLALANIYVYDLILLGSILMGVGGVVLLIHWLND